MKRPPTQSVRGSKTGRPIMVLLDILGRRWSLRILWELRDGPLTFRVLRDRCDLVSPSVLNTRLKELRALDLAELTPDGFAYTVWGKELSEQLAHLNAWSDIWALRNSTD